MFTRKKVINMDVVALGELLIDFTNTRVDSMNYPTMEAHPGGAPANFLSTLSKYGIKCALLGKVGNDSFGHLLVNTLKENHVETKGIIESNDYFTTLAFVTLDNKGNREFAFARKPGADTTLLTEEVNYDLIKDAKVFHFGTLSLTTSPSKEATISALNYAKENNKIISFDPNLRKPLWNNLKDAKDAILFGLKNSDIIKISDSEVKFLFDLEPKEAVKYLFKEFNPKIVYVTCGENGVYFSNDGINIEYRESLLFKATIDTTGAGDIFGGSCLYKLLSLNKDINDITIDELRDAVHFGTIAAGLSTLKHGGISSIPTYSEVMMYYKNKAIYQ